MIAAATRRARRRRCCSSAWRRRQIPTRWQPYLDGFGTSTSDPAVAACRARCGLPTSGKALNSLYLARRRRGERTRRLLGRRRQPRRAGTRTCQTPISSARSRSTARTTRGDVLGAQRLERRVDVRLRVVEVERGAQPAGAHGGGDARRREPLGRARHVDARRSPSSTARARAPRGSGSRGRRCAVDRLDADLARAARAPAPRRPTRTTRATCRAAAPSPRAAAAGRTGRRTDPAPPTSRRGAASRARSRSAARPGTPCRAGRAATCSRAQTTKSTRRGRTAASRTPASRRRRRARRGARRGGDRVEVGDPPVDDCTALTATSVVDGRSRRPAARAAPRRPSPRAPPARATGRAADVKSPSATSTRASAGQRRGDEADERRHRRRPTATVEAGKPTSCAHASRARSVQGPTLPARRPAAPVLERRCSASYAMRGGNPKLAVSRNGPPAAPLARPHPLSRGRSRGSHSLHEPG